jgi:hypothetical protein
MSIGQTALDLREQNLSPRMAVRKSSIGKDVFRPAEKEADKVATKL